MEGNRQKDSTGEEWSKEGTRRTTTEEGSLGSNPSDLGLGEEKLGVW